MTPSTARDHGSVPADDGRPAYRLCGVRVDAVGPDRAADLIVGAAVQRRSSAVHLCNAYTLSLAYRDPEFASIVDQGDLNLMDGMPLVWVARRLGFTAVEDRVYGPDLMLDVMRRGVEPGLGHYLLGGGPEVIATLPVGLETRIPGVRIVGAESPPFREPSPAELTAMIDRIRASEAHVVWVGLGTPKQNRFVQAHHHQVPAAMIGVGAAFDFHAGRKPQAPRWMQRAGLEWAFRLATEPRRLWRRYLIGNAVFLYGLARTLERGDRRT